MAAPAAVASHGDATHGAAPHSASDEPTKIHPVNVSTPHPYDASTNYTWEIHVEGASSISVHFERYEVPGYYSSFRDECRGDEIILSDVNTGEELDRICGTPRDAGEDFWTQDFETDTLNITLAADDRNEGYGFDIYEVAADGARPLFSVPYSEQPRAYASPTVSAEPDPFQHERSSASASISGYANWGEGTSASQTTSASAGEYWDCSGLSCEEVDGYQFEDRTSVQAAGTGVDLLFETALDNEGEVRYVQLRCAIDGDDHCQPG